jgi:hypothetical protein
VIERLGHVSSAVPEADLEDRVDEFVVRWADETLRVVEELLLGDSGTFESERERELGPLCLRS